MRHPCGILLCVAAALVLPGCMPVVTIRPESGPTASDADLVIVDAALVDTIHRGKQLLYSRPRELPSFASPTVIQLNAGTYTIAYHVEHGEVGPEAARIDEIALKPGHRYRAGRSVCGYWSPKHGCSFAWGMLYQSNCSVVFLWIEDAAAGQVVAGSKTEPAAREGYGGLLSTCD
jgi:hypothetical protein